MSEEIVNKIAQSGLITLDPADFIPREKIMVFDLKDFLFMGMILKEKDFREALKQYDWESLRDQTVTLTCTADAIIPVWAYMLVTTYLSGIAKEVLMGNELEARRQLFQRKLSELPVEPYRDQRVLIKGCGDELIEEFVYTALTQKLVPVAKSVMYGEPCSTVPVYKRK
jgi:hypothetical protein